VARAKRTDRTEARRRHRAEQAALVVVASEAGADVAQSAASNPSAKGTQTPAKGAQPAPAQRPGITSSFRAAYRPAHIREDLRLLPLVLTNWGFLAAVGASLAAVAYFVIAYSPAISSVPVAPAPNAGFTAVVQANPLPYYLGTAVIAGPPAVGAFVIGFTAKRASWLGGLLYGIYTTILLLVVLQTPAGRLLTGDGPTEAVIISGAAWAPMSACLFAAAAAWYRRFLDLANPNRGQKSQAKAQQGRGNAKPKTAR